MFVIFGRRKSKKFLGLTREIHCNYCNHASSFRAFHCKSWFTLFFIPLIPYADDYYLICPSCDNSIEVSKEGALSQIPGHPEYEDKITYEQEHLAIEQTLTEEEVARKQSFLQAMKEKAETREQ